MGGLSGVAVRPADVLKGVILSNAASFILGHNHPGGDPTPSSEDREFTRTIEAAAKAIGIPMVDHIVTSPNGRHRSFYALGLLSKAE
jgi:DNA repair protein RadC